MLVELRVGNYKSFKDEQVFSMVADTDTAFADTNVFAQTENCPALLKTAAIYGANASGKSNLLKSIVFMIAKLFNDIYPLWQDQDGKTHAMWRNFASFTPFKLDSESADKASSFELTFLDEGVRYQYGFAIDKVRVLEEWLIVYKKGQPQKWFEREYDATNEQYKYSYSKYLKGQKAVWERATRADALYLATATVLNSEQLSDVYRIIREDFCPLTLAVGTAKVYDVQLLRLKENPEYKKMLIDFLKKADLGIVDIRIIQEKSYQPLGVSVTASNGESVQNIADDKLKILFIHKNSDTSEEVAFEPSEESLGTIKFFALVCDILDAVTEGQILIVDELENSLHPAMTKAIIELFNSETNKAGQLIFTTHSTELMTQEIFRRDQIWFVEKHSDGASEVYPLSDFSPRKNEKIAPRYLAGCYGAVPFVQKFMGE